MRLKQEKPKSKQKQKQTDYEQLGKMLANIYETGYIDRNQTYKMTFVKGVFAGLGGVVGATIVVAILLWVLSLFQTVPVLDRLYNNLNHTVNSQSR